MSENTWNDPRITAYVLDELSGEDRAAFERELESSAQLAAAVEEARSLTEQLSALYLSEETPPLDDERREAILGFESSPVTPASASPARSLRLPVTLLAAAAVLVLMIGVAPLLNQPKLDSTVVQSTQETAVQSTQETAVQSTQDTALQGAPRVELERREAKKELELIPGEFGEEELLERPQAAISKQHVKKLQDVDESTDGLVETLEEISEVEIRLDDTPPPTKALGGALGGARKGVTRSLAESEPEPMKLGEDSDGDDAYDALGASIGGGAGFARGIDSDGVAREPLGDVPSGGRQRAADSRGSGQSAEQKARSLRVLGRDESVWDKLGTDEVSRQRAVEDSIVEEVRGEEPGGTKRSVARDRQSSAEPLFGGLPSQRSRSIQLPPAAEQEQGARGRATQSFRRAGDWEEADVTRELKSASAESEPMPAPVEAAAAPANQPSKDFAVVPSEEPGSLEGIDSSGTLQQYKIDPTRMPERSRERVLGIDEKAIAGPITANRAKEVAENRLYYQDKKGEVEAAIPRFERPENRFSEVTESFDSIKNPGDEAPGRGGVAMRRRSARGLGDAGMLDLDRERTLPRLWGTVPPDAEGEGPGKAGDRFDPITDNAFRRVSEHPLSTFSVDVDTASYSKVRDFLMRAEQLPNPDAVRIEEMVNYFDYDYQPPKADSEHPFAVEAKITSCPWNETHRLARVSLKGKTIKKKQRPPCNLVFLLDTSGSMDAENKLPLVIKGMNMLLDQLREKDKVAITVYAGSAGLVLDSTSARKKEKISRALSELTAGGSTDGGSGIALAYRTARDHYIAAGVNRVILCTDGDFNVGLTNNSDLVRMVEKEAKGGIFLSVLGFGMGNHNDAMLEQISGRGNGNYAFIDTEAEARKVLVDQTNSTLVTIAKNVKLQVDFNVREVSAYRLIGYENRVLAKEDFNNDKKDAGEIGAGHSVTALYELVPADVEAELAAPKVDPLKYQSEPQPTDAALSGETMTLKLRYLLPDAVVERGDESTLVEIPVTDQGDRFEDADSEFRFAAAVAGFGMKLRRSEYAGSWTLSDVIRVASSAGGKDKYELRAEFVDLVRRASDLMGQQ